MAQPKTIVLFSDGTGNSSGKLFKTNVWRMYEALDLGPATAGKREQIAFYDDGVGTSGIGIWAMITGVFGYGLKRNVLDIYRYACRNYRPEEGQAPGPNPDGKGDQLYGFGFSRGGFTMRIAAALIADQGLVVAGDEAELERRTFDAYRAFRSCFLPGKLKWPIKAMRAVRDAMIGSWRQIVGRSAYDARQNYHPVIRFLGIWDTVSAYGGPILELTRAIDDWVFPLSMPDYELNKSVRDARHALALDDRRDAFHPLLWDEVHEKKLIEGGEVANDRLQQVWFAGMHADVGGGYPDESLSYVSLLWILEEAEKADLRTVKVITDRHRALASSFGPIHDSRAGPGAYYRYQPRRIGAWLDPPEAHTTILRDPAMRHSSGQPRGLLRSVKVHESVVARIAGGTDGYAPITLPADFDIVPPQSDGETAPQADSTTPVVPDAPQLYHRMVSGDIRAKLRDPETVRLRAKAGERIWDAVLRRRLIYFATLAVTVWLVLLPFSRGSWTLTRNLCSDDRCVLPWIIDQTKYFVPKFAERWIDAYANKPMTFLILVGLLLFLLWFGAKSEMRLQDRSLSIWKAALGKGDWPAPPKGWFSRVTWAGLRAVRTSTAYQLLLRVMKWNILPTAIGLTMLLALLYGTAVAVTQIRLAWKEPRRHFCQGGALERPIGKPGIQGRFDISEICTGLGGGVLKGQTYQVTLSGLRGGDDKPGPWTDDGISATPQGLHARDLGVAGRLGAPFRRVVSARYLQPLVEIRGVRSTRWRPAVDIHELKLKPVGQDAYSGTFTAKRSGDLHLFVNDVAPPFGLIRRFYGNNAGSATVRVRHVQPAPGLPPVPAVQSPSAPGG